MSKTAIQELIERYEALKINDKNVSSFTKAYINSFIKDMRESLKKEKEQIKKAYDKGTIHNTATGVAMDGEDYYDQTYNS